MSAKQNQLNYIKNYNKQHYKSVNIMFRIDSSEEAEMLNFLHEQPSTMGFIKELIKEAMANNNANKEVC